MKYAKATEAIIRLCGSKDSIELEIVDKGNRIQRACLMDGLKTVHTRAEAIGGNTYYALKERYLLTLTGRSDASSKFPKSNRVGYFPSFGVAWRASEESFLKSVRWLNELKFRASAGYTGTQNIGNYLFYTLYTPGSYASTNAIIPTQLGNDKIKWESTLQKDAGVDFALFNSRLRGAFGYYQKETSGLLMAYSVATSSGFSSALVNVANVSNKGIEIDLRGDVIRAKELSWNVAVNVSGNRYRDFVKY